MLDAALRVIRERCARDRARVIGAVLVVAFAGALGFVPLFDGPGYELALACGFVVPTVAAVAVALDLSSRPRDPFHAYCRAVGTGAGYALLAYASGVAHGIRAGFCDAAGGSLLFALGPGIGSVLGALWGAVAAEPALRVRRRRLVAVAAGLAGPLGAIAFGLWLFWSTPAVFAYSPFVGYFSGSLYDTVIEPRGLLAYRAESAATLLAAYVLALHLQRRPGEPRLRFRWLGRPGMVALGVASLAGSLVGVALGGELGHHQTSATIAAELGGRLQTERCEVVYAQSLVLEDVRRFARECDASVREVARGLGVEPVRIRAFLFADAAQKRRLMGAGAVYIAKPWRREIYLHDIGYPNRVLSHELVHVLAAPLGRGPFEVAGSFGGLLPNPGLIEGLAVAFSPPEGELSPEEWAKAMRDIGVLPRLDELFAIGFLGQHSDTAYTAAGAFVRWLRDEYGLEVVQRWYGGADLAALTGADLPELEREWHAVLDRLTLTPQAVAQARARFDQPGVFGRACPHAVDNLLGDAASAAGAGDCGRAIRSYDEALALDAHNARGLVDRASCSDVLGERGTRHDELRRLAEDDSLHPRLRERALERLADLLLRDDQAADAAQLYARLSADALGEDRLRTLDVKAWAAEHALARPAVVALLVGRPGRGADAIEAMDLLGRWRATDPDDGLPEYLIGRQHANAHRYDLAAERLDAALGLRLALPRVRAEAVRLRLEVACAVEDHATARRLHDVYVALDCVSTTRRRELEALLDRCLPPG